MKGETNFHMKPKEYSFVSKPATRWNHTTTNKRVKVTGGDERDSVASGK
jgi:hypothetical protein